MSTLAAALITLATGLLIAGLAEYVREWINGMDKAIELGSCLYSLIRRSSRRLGHLACLGQTKGSARVRRRDDRAAYSVK